MAEAKAHENVVEKWGLPFCTHTPLIERRLCHRHFMLRIQGTHSHFIWLMKWWLHDRRGKLRGPQAAVPLHLVPTCCNEGVTQKEDFHFCLPSTSDHWHRELAWGDKQTIKQVAPNLFPKKMTSLDTEHGEAQT